jgi:tRNA1(Val) A37 N6-methylase TrmN6
MARPNGLLTLIHRPDCLDKLLEVIYGRFGGITVFPLFPKAGEAASRIIVQARKGSRAGISLMPGLVLHEADGRYTEAAEAVLRGGDALELRRSSD